MSNISAHSSHELQPAMEERIRAIAAEVFQTDAARIELSMGPDDIDRWDSLNHLRLITEVENAFSIRLTMRQIEQIRSLADVATVVSEGSS